MGRRSYRTINIEKVAGVLTLDELTRFIINCDNEKRETGWFQDLNKLYKNSCKETDLLEYSFHWYSSPEGSDYWCEIYESVAYND